MALGIEKYFYDRPCQPIGVIWFAVSCRRIPHTGEQNNVNLNKNTLKMLLQILLKKLNAPQASFSSLISDVIRF